jgi:16S rRNA (adenine(1408)-N(1))-methyltransferase
LAARHERVVVDIGTGSGSAVLRRAARERRTMFFALDADASAIADTSRRAARPANKGGHANIVFLAAAAETLPGPLSALADEMTVVLPWGSLLQAVLNPRTDTFARVAAVLKPAGEMTLLVSAQQRDGIGAPLDALRAEELANGYASTGLTIIDVREATRADVERLSSGWGRRLGIPERRAAWLFSLRV